jgi:excisionase family DNA binding protein
MTTVLDTASPSTRRLLDANQVAARLGISRRQVFRAADAGTIPTGCKVGRLRRWDATVIDEFIEGGCKPTRTRSR